MKRKDLIKFVEKEVKQLKKEFDFLADASQRELKGPLETIRDETIRAMESVHEQIDKFETIKGKLIEGVSKKAFAHLESRVFNINYLYAIDRKEFMGYYQAKVRG